MGQLNKIWKIVIQLIFINQLYFYLACLPPSQRKSLSLKWTATAATKQPKTHGKFILSIWNKIGGALNKADLDYTSRNSQNTHKKNGDFSTRILTTLAQWPPPTSTPVLLGQQDLRHYLRPKHHHSRIIVKWG